MKKWAVLIICFAGWCGLGVLTIGVGSAGAQSQAGGSVERIVSTAPNLAEILFGLGLDEEIVGVTMFSKHPPAVADKPKIGSFWQLNIEAIIAARPDLVVSLDFARQKSMTQRLDAMGYGTLTVNIETIDGLFDSIEQIGTAVGRDDAAGELVGAMKAGLTEVRQRVAGQERPKVLWVVQRDPLRVAGRDTFINEMIELAGGVNAIGETVHQYPPIGTEQVMAVRPDVIIEPSMTEADIEKFEDGARDFWKRYENLPAVKQGRVFAVNGDLVSQLGPRLGRGVEEIARILHPQAFGEDN